MDLEKLRALFDLLAEKDIAEFEHEEEGVRVRVSRGARVVACRRALGRSPLGALGRPAARGALGRVAAPRRRPAATPST